LKHCPSHVQILGNEKGDEMANFQVKQEKLLSNSTRSIEHADLKKFIQKKQS